MHDALSDQEAGSSPAGRTEGMGTTLTTAYSVGNDLFVIHVGDSRAYLMRAGRLHRITRDHTLAQSYADQGLIPQAEVESHELGHVLTATEVRHESQGCRVARTDCRSGARW